jgi:hypothetical protein
MSLNKKKEETKGIRATIMLEILGKPAEYLVETLNKLIKNIDEEKGVRVIEKKINEPILMKDSKEFYTTFAEVDVEVDDILYLTIIMFKYMPSHIEVIEPELIALTNNGWTDILSELTRRLHKYDEVARIVQIQNAQMKKKLDEVLSKEAENKESSSDIVSPEKKTSKKK